MSCYEHFLYASGTLNQDNMVNSNLTTNMHFVCPQSYGIHHKSQKEIELLTYVDYVDHASPAYVSGMRPGG